MLTETGGLYLYEVAQLGGNDEDVGGQRHLAEALELLIIHVDLLHRRVQRVVTGGESTNTRRSVNVGPSSKIERTSELF